LCVTLTVDNVNDVDKDGWTALHCASRGGYVHCVKLCITMGANVNACTKYGSTPLQLAAKAAHDDVLLELLHAGAIVDSTNNDGWTPLRRAIYYKRFDMAQLLIDWGAKVSNVKLVEYVPAIPDWVTTFIESRSNCRTVSIIIIRRNTQIPSYNSHWQQRHQCVAIDIQTHMVNSMEDVWIIPPIELK
jgi:ankyrin repeat protein